MLELRHPFRAFRPGSASRVDDGASVAATRRALEVRELVPEEHPLWARLVAESPHGSVYALPGYLAALCQATGGSFRILAVLRDQEILGGLPLYSDPSRFGPRVEPRALLRYNGFVLRADPGKYPSQRTARELVVLAELEAALRQRRFARLSLQSRDPLQDFRVFIDRGWRARPSYTYTVPLEDLGALWARTEQNLRRLVNRAEREQLVLTDDDDFASFQRMYRQTHLRKGLPLHLPDAQFAAWFRTLHALGLCRLFQARRPDGISIAAQVVLTGPHPVSHTIMAAADVEYLSCGSNAFLRWRVFENLAGRGFIANDLTDASLNGVTHFKSQLGGDLRMSVTLSRPDSVALQLGHTAVHLVRVARLRR